MTTHSKNTSSAKGAEKSCCFADLNLHPKLLKQLDKLSFINPTPIQKDSIPVALSGKDVIGLAQTGTGKTLAFCLPILHSHLISHYKARSLIILPTRELAAQVEETFKAVGNSLKLRTALLIGGAPMKPQKRLLRENPDIIVATPGRLIDHLQGHALDLRTVEILVLDEADRMLDMGFEPQIKQILQGVPAERQTLLFSATMPKPIAKIAQKYMRKPERVEVARSGDTAKDVSQELHFVEKNKKNGLLKSILTEHEGTVLVFVRTRRGASRIARAVRQAGYAAAEIHSDRSLSQRRAALDGFKSGKYRVLIATDIAARGIDVSDIEVVINYDLPDCAEDYVHRIGRTGRAGKSGQAISFASPDQMKLVRAIERLIRINLPIAETSMIPKEARQQPSNKSKGRTSNRPSRGFMRKKRGPRKLSSLRRGKKFSGARKKQKRK